MKPLTAWLLSDHFDWCRTQVSDAVHVASTSLVVCTIGVLAILFDTVPVYCLSPWSDLKMYCFTRHCGVEVEVEVEVDSALPQVEVDLALPQVEGASALPQVEGASALPQVEVHHPATHHSSVVINIYFGTTWIAWLQRWGGMYCLTYHRPFPTVTVTKTYGYLSYLDYMLGVTRVIFIQYKFIGPGWTLPPDQLNSVLLFLARSKPSRQWLLTPAHFTRALQPSVVIYALRCHHVVKHALTARLNKDVVRIILGYL